MAKTLFLILLALLTTLHADVKKGRRFYMKSLKFKVGMTSADFTAQHTAQEWAARFEEDGQLLIEELSTQYPKYRTFFHGKRFMRALPHLNDFTRAYAADSGNVPSCGQDAEPAVNLTGMSQQSLF